MVENQAKSDALFKALSDPSRRRIVEALSEGECTVGELAAPLDMSLAGASKHIGVLEDAGLLLREKRGRERVCKLHPQGLFALRDWVARYSAFWDARLEALDKALKDEKRQEKGDE